MKLKAIYFLFCILSSTHMYSQYVIENYTNANMQQISSVKQIADWIQFNNAESIFPFLSKTASIDLDYLKIESSFLSKEYPRHKIMSNIETPISDDRNIVWYKRNIHKKSGKKLKARYQIYFTVEYIDGFYQIIDLTFGKKKKINTDNYTKN